MGGALLSGPAARMPASWMSRNRCQALGSDLTGGLHQPAHRQDQRHDVARGDARVHRAGRYGACGELVDRCSYPVSGGVVGLARQEQAARSAHGRRRTGRGRAAVLRDRTRRHAPAPVRWTTGSPRAPARAVHRSARPCWRTGGTRCRRPRRPARRSPPCTRRRRTRRAPRARRRGCGDSSARRRAVPPGPGFRSLALVPDDRSRRRPSPSRPCSGSPPSAPGRVAEGISRPASAASTSPAAITANPIV